MLAVVKSSDFIVCVVDGVSSRSDDHCLTDKETESQGGEVDLPKKEGLTRWDSLLGVKPLFSPFRIVCLPLGSSEKSRRG